MAHPPEPIRQPKKRFKLQVRYNNQEREDVVYFSNKPTPRTFGVIGGEDIFIVESENEIFTCLSQQVFSFSVTEE